MCPVIEAQEPVLVAKNRSPSNALLKNRNAETTCCPQAENKKGHRSAMTLEGKILSATDQAALFFRERLATHSPPINPSPMRETEEGSGTLGRMEES